MARIATHLEAAGHRVVRFWRASSEWTSPGAPPRIVQPFLLWNNRAVLDELQRLHQETKPAAWILHNVVPVISLGVYGLAKRLGVPVIQWLHNYRPVSPSGTLRAGRRMLDVQDRWLALREIGAGSWLDSRLLTAWLTLGYNLLQWRDDFTCVRAWIAISDELNALLQRSRFPFSYLVTLRHGWDLGPRAAADGDGGYFLFLARMVELKGVRFLLDLWNQPELRDIPLVMAGDGPLYQELRHRSPPHVKWVGFVDGEEKRRWIAGCRAILFPAQWPEPLGLVVYEAFEQSKPVVATALGGIMELVRDGVTGHLLEPGDVKGWTQAILRLAGDPSLARGLGENGRRWLEQNVSTTAWNRRFDEILAEVLS